MIELEPALVDLAEHLDHPAGDRLTAAVRNRLSAPGPARVHTTRPPDRSRSLLAVAAVFVLIVAAALAIPPARHAIADWLGIGAIEVRRSDAPLSGDGAPGHTVPGAPDTTRHDINVPGQLAEARKIAEFTIATPRDASVGSLRSVDVARRVPGGLVALVYPRFTLVEVATGGENPTAIAKFIDRAARVDYVTVNGSPGLWIAGAHQIVFLNRFGQVETDTVRRSGPVLIWEHGGVTYRIEGLTSLAAAQEIAASIR